MAYTVKYTHEAFPDDREFDIRGLGLLKNGESVTVDEELERNFILVNRRTIEDAFGDDDHFEVSGTSEVSGGIKDVLGIELDEISDTPDILANRELEIQEAEAEAAKPVTPMTVPVTPTVAPVVPNINTNDDT